MNFSLNHSKDTFPDYLIVPVAQQETNKQCFEQVSNLTGIAVDCIKADFQAALKETHTIYYQQHGSSKRVVLLGLGKSSGFQQVMVAFRSYFHRKKSNLKGDIGIHFNLHNTADQSEQWVEAAVNGILLGEYNIGLYKTNGSSPKKDPSSTSLNVQIFVDNSQANKSKQAIELGQKMAKTQVQIFDLVNAPSNKKTPQTLADWATQSGKDFGYDVKVLEKKEIESLGLHALLAVNRGSEDPPTFIVMEYKPANATQKIGLVGKGVTFDTGGLSIKPSANMHYMKSDMGGAAAVMGTMEMAAKLNLPIHLMGVVPATDNSVDSKSIKPGDVINSYDGKTIEVIDTDAEGRLILADGLAYVVKHFQPDILIDLATLTGSCIRALGTYAGGLFSNNDSLIQALISSSQATGERLWQFPLWEDYDKEMKSDVADIKNFSGNPSAGAITAAKFLQAFIQEHTTWAHMDIAGVAVSDSEFSSHKSATAFGVRLLIHYLRQLPKKAG